MSLPATPIRCSREEGLRRRILLEEHLPCEEVAPELEPSISDPCDPRLTDWAFRNVNYYKGGKACTCAICFPWPVRRR